MPERHAPSRTASAHEQLACIASSRSVHSAFDFLRKNEPAWIADQLAMLRIPAPPFGESARAEWLRDRFAALGLADVHLDSIGNVIGLHRGARHRKATEKALLISAHI